MFELTWGGPRLRVHIFAQVVIIIVFVVVIVFVVLLPLLLASFRRLRLFDLLYCFLLFALALLGLCLLLSRVFCCSGCRCRFCRRLVRCSLPSIFLLVGLTPTPLVVVTNLRSGDIIRLSLSAWLRTVSIRCAYCKKVRQGTLRPANPISSSPSGHDAVPLSRGRDRMRQCERAQEEVFERCCVLAIRDAQCQANAGPKARHLKRYAVSRASCSSPLDLPKLDVLLMHLERA